MKKLLQAWLTLLALPAQAIECEFEAPCWVSDLVAHVCWPEVPGTSQYLIAVTPQEGPAMAYTTTETEHRFWCPTSQPFTFQVTPRAIDGTLRKPSNISPPIHCGRAFDTNADGELTYPQDEQAFLNVYELGCKVPKE